MVIETDDHLVDAKAVWDGQSVVFFGAIPDMPYVSTPPFLRLKAPQQRGGQGSVAVLPLLLLALLRLINLIPPQCCC